MNNKNHFFYSYCGNKRNEANDIIDNIDFNGIENIIETFCGSSAISFHIWLKYGDKFNYYLNDNSKSLMMIYDLFKNESLEKINEELMNIDKQITNKEEWNKHFKTAPETPYKELFYLKFSSFGRKGFYPLNRKAKKQFEPSLNQELFIKFIKCPYVFITCGDWFEVFDKHSNNPKSLIIFDPPYINSCNDFYLEKSLNIYEYFYDNKIESFKSPIYLILEDIWIIRMLFSNNKILKTYDKKYEISKKKTSHIIIKQ